ncbi:Alpha/Beta hydrolase protein [Mycena floridula]|nr:Alpha/Beta hydrolase protein [Mycena floridula]
MRLPISPKSLGRRRWITTSAVDLEFSRTVPVDNNANERPLLILHGLFGSKRNWGSFTKAFSRSLNRPVYALDLRNHGTSPVQRPMTYTDMASDVLRFMQKHSLSNVSLLGHSMGGKAAMAVALSPSLSESTISRLIIADIAPSKGALSPEFRSYVEAMKKIDDARVSTRKQAMEILNEYEKDPSICAFLMTNLVVPPDGPVHFRLPLDILEESVSEIGSFPYNPGEASWPGPTLFIKGTKSAFINRHNIPLAEQLFPNMRLETLEAGHWGK